ncbi:hypothetical protein [Halomonas getboli]|uniref:hypothetical protein n=1 Tax=Halomonas getboli TaxID=2935862 RepID=UPI001FFF0322|nr:hypothetical protein [Halomonas getboli]MCK2183554.1 hypothetical protein [Halomonas getboli]
MMPMLRGSWAMICPCGATEIRAPQGPRWASFTLRRVDAYRYRVTCQACGHTTEHATSPRVAGAGHGAQR